MHSHPLTFPGASGHALAARLELPPGAVRGTAIFAHCFTCSMNLNAVVHIARALTAEGVAVLRFDFTGLGESAGDWSETNFSSTVADLRAAAAFLAGRGLETQLLVGHSLGGAAVLAAAERIPGVRGVATIAAPADPWHVTGLLGPGGADAERDGEATVHLGGRPFRVRRQLLDDLRTASMEAAIRHLTLPLLLLHSPDDTTVPLDHATRIYKAARGPRSFVSLDGADHLLSRRGDAEYAARMIAAWASRFLAPPGAEAPARGVATGEVVTVTPARGLRTEVAAGPHLLAVDEPAALGGTDTAPAPLDFVLAGLGACTGMTLRLYADRKGWPLEETTVRLRKLPSDDPAARTRIARTVVVEGPLDDAQRARLTEIAGKCPVHRLLETGLEIETVVRTDSGSG